MYKKYSIIILILIICSSCVPAPYYATFYENLELPVWTDAYDVWSLDNERWLMRGFDDSKRYKNKKRDINIVNKYLLNNALCYATTKAKNETTVYSKNPYRISITVYGFSDIHTSFTVKQINVNSISGNDLSLLINEDLPRTILLEKEFADSSLVRGSYRTDEIFNFKKEAIIITFTLEINTIHGSEIGNVVFELNPVVKWGLFQMLD